MPPTHSCMGSLPSANTISLHYKSQWQSTGFFSRTIWLPIDIFPKKIVKRKLGFFKITAISSAFPSFRLVHTAMKDLPRKRSGKDLLGGGLSAFKSLDFHYSSEIFFPVRSCFFFPIRFFRSRRLSFAASVGFVFVRDFGLRAACRISCARRASASSRFFSCERNLCARITISPREVTIRPAPWSSRSRTSAGRLMEWSASKRKSATVATLLTFWPPGPDDRTNSNRISRSSICMASLIFIILERHNSGEGRIRRCWTATLYSPLTLSARNKMLFERAMKRDDQHLSRARILSQDESFSKK
jgi:hypothetical protein